MGRAPCEAKARERAMVGTNWHYVENGKPVGPVSFDVLRQMVAEGRLGANDLVWREGEGNWRVAGSVAGLVGPGAPVERPVEASAAPRGGYAPPPNYYGQPDAMQYYGPRAVGPSQQGMAIAGFVLSLTIPILGLIFSWIALSGMKRTGNEEGKGLATAGLIISLVVVGLGCLWVIGVVSCLGAGAHFGP